MTYPGQFYRIVFIGSLYSDIFNMTLSVVPEGAGGVRKLTQSEVDGIAATIRTWWRLTAAAGGWGITSNAVLTSVKINRIGANGRYVDPEVMEHVYTTPAAGGGDSSHPAQVALAATIRGADERARAGKGRMYFPWNEYFNILDQFSGRLLAGNAALAAQRFATLLDNIDGHFIDLGTGALCGIASKQGTGAFQRRLRVSVGRTPDTIRSRRNKLPEDPQFYPVVPA